MTTGNSGGNSGPSPVPPSIWSKPTIAKPSSSGPMPSSSYTASIYQGAPAPQPVPGSVTGPRPAVVAPPVTGYAPQGPPIPPGVQLSRAEYLMRRGAAGDLVRSNWFRGLRGGQSDLLAAAAVGISAVVSAIIAIPAVEHWSIVLTICGYIWWTALAIGLVGLGTRLAQGLVTYGIVPVALAISAVWALHTCLQMVDLRDASVSIPLPVATMTELAIQLVFFVAATAVCAVLLGTMSNAYGRMSGR